MPETYLSYGQNTLFCRHSAIREGQPSLLFIHGLGDSGLAFAEIFDDPRFESFNIVVPDLLGYGRSSHSPSRNYSFDLHLDYLWKIIEHFGLSEVTLVGHSMGGDLGTLLCLQEAHLLRSHQPPLREPRIKRFLNIEGNLTEDDLFISRIAHEEAEKGRFDDWFRWDYTYRQVFGGWCQRWPFGRRYLASLQFCDPAAFRQNAAELFRNGSDAGMRYREISIPRIFVFGQRSLHPESRKFVHRQGLKALEMVGSFHWPMIDCADEFYGALARFCQGDDRGGEIAEQASCNEEPARRRVAQVEVGKSAEYDDPCVQATLEESNIPRLIRDARREQDRILWERYNGRALRIADIGCGNGYHAERYAPGCTLFHGYEISPAMVEIARNRCKRFANVRILEGNALDMELASERYDVIWSLYFTPGNLRERRKTLSDYDESYLAENTCFIEIIGRFFATLEEGGSLFLNVYKDTPEAEDAQRSFYWRTGQIVLTDFGSPFVATDKGFWSMRWTKERMLSHLEKATVERADVSFIDLNEISWLVEARKTGTVGERTPMPFTDNRSA